MSAADDPAPILGFDPIPLFATGLHLGDADLLVGGPTGQVIGRTAAASLLLRDAHGRNPVQGITVAAPPLSV